MDRPEHAGTAYELKTDSGIDLLSDKCIFDYQTFTFLYSALGVKKTEHAGTVS